jgi:hypothetical protein
LRLVQSGADARQGLDAGEGIARVQFTRDDGAFGPADLDKAAVLSRRLGVSVQLGT